MAYNKEGNLRLRNNKKVIFDQGGELYSDGTDIITSVTVSGVTPTEEYHLTTKSYVDDEIDSDISTLSGTLQTNIDGKDNYASWSFAVDGETKDAITSGDVLYFVGGDNITITRSADDQITISGAAVAGISDIVEDTTPQLGGDLDVNSHSIVSTSNGDITITPNGSGDIILDSQKWPQADGANEQVITTDGVGQLSWTGSTYVPPGSLERAVFDYGGVDEIFINPGAYFHKGTAEQFVYWDSQLTFQFGSAGSNPDSTDLGATDWFYLYIDDSSVVASGTNQLIANNFVAVTTEPTWSNNKHGWYNGNDRCIFAVLTDDSNNIVKFFHSGIEFICYAGQIIDLVSTDIDTTWVEVTLTIPSFSTEAATSFRMDYIGGSAFSWWRTDGTSDIGHIACRVIDNVTDSINQIRVRTSSLQKIEIKHSASNATESRISTNGWYLPKGL